MSATVDGDANSERLIVWLNAAEQVLLREAAQLQQISLGEFVLRSAMQAAGHVVAAPGEIRADAMAWNNLLAILELPPNVAPDVQSRVQRALTG